MTTVRDKVHKEFEALASEARELANKALREVDDVLGIEVRPETCGDPDISAVAIKPIDRSTIDALFDELGIDLQ